MAQNHLAEIIRKHGLYLNNNPAGVKADLHGADLSGVDLFRADLRLADFSRANLSNANLSGANLRGADFSMADLFLVDLSRSNLSFAYMSWANLRRVDLSEADLTSANLSHAHLHDINWSNANVENIDLEGSNPDEAMRNSNCYFVDEIDDLSTRRWTQIAGTMREAMIIAFDHAREGIPPIDYHEIFREVSNDLNKPDLRMLIAGFSDAHRWIGGPAFVNLLLGAGLSLDVFCQGLRSVMEGKEELHEWGGTYNVISKSRDDLDCIWLRMHFDLETGCTWRVDGCSALAGDSSIPSGMIWKEWHACNENNSKTHPSAPSRQSATPPTSSPLQSAPSTTPAPSWQVAILNRYSPEERELLNKVPWEDLPQELKDKTISNHDDPISQEMDPSVPMRWP